MQNESPPEAVMIELNRLKTDTYPTTDFYRRSAALERAKRAVRKQIPRKPEEHDSFIAYCCPNCGEKLLNCNNFCPECGQALDWSDV